jgi:hypothetical protein
MPWWRNSADDSPPREERYTLDKIRGMLDEIGGSRLQVIDPRLKVLLTLIAQRGEDKFLENNDGAPSDAAIVSFQTNLETILRVLREYVNIQDKQSSKPKYADLLRDGYEAVLGFSVQLLQTDTPGGTRSHSEYAVDTKILSAQRHR